LTLAKTNSSSLQTLLTFYKFVPEEKQKILKTFAAEESKFGYFLLDPELKTFKRVDGPAAASSHLPPPPPSLEDRKRKLFETAEMLLGELRNPRRSMAIFRILMGVLDPSTVSPIDLSVKKMGENTKKVYVINIVDFIDTILENNRPSEEMSSFFKYIKSKGVRIPACYVENKHFKR
jgi:hypothetical protein